jgi:hypothetical protein
VRPEGMCQRILTIKLSGIEPANFRLVAQCLNQLRHRVPRLKLGKSKFVFERSIMFQLKYVLNCNYANMPHVQLCTQFHPIAFPEFLLHLHTKWLRKISLRPYILSNNFQKICIFLRTEKLSNRKGKYIR